MVNSTVSDDTGQSLGSAVESNGISQASGSLMLDESAREDIEARVEAMGPRERVAWADEITNRLRGCVVDVVDAHFTFEERKRILLETLQEAAFGGARRINGYETWDEYWAAEFTEAKLFSSVSERNELISHLKSNGFSQRQIATIVGLSHVGVLKVLKKSEIGSERPQSTIKPTDSSQSGQLVTKLPVGHPESSQSSDSDADDDYLSRPVVHGINDRDQAVPRSAGEIARDYLWLSGLKWFDGLSSRAVAERTGLPRKTVAYTLDRGAVEYKAVGRVWLEVMRLHGEGRSLAAISQETGIQLAGVRYAFEVLQGDCDAENAPAPLWIRDIVNQKSLEDWWGDGTSHDHPLKLEDGRDTSVGELASLLKISQPRVTQSLESWAMEIGLPDRKRKADPDSVANANEYRVRPEADWRLLVGVKEDAVVASESWQADQLGRDMWQQFHRKPQQIIDASAFSILYWELTKQGIEVILDSLDMEHMLKVNGQFEEDNRGPLHSHSYLEISYVVQGSYSFVLNENIVTIPQGNVCIIAQNVNHQDIQRHDGSKIIFLRVTADDFRTVFSKRSEWEVQNMLNKLVMRQYNQYSIMQFTPVSHHNDADALIELICRETHEKRIGAHSIIHGLLLRLLDTLRMKFRIKLKQEEQISLQRVLASDIERLIRERYGNVELADIERCFHYNKDYYNRLLRAHTGLTFQTYRQNVRLDAAHSFITQDNMPVTEAAHIVGYHNMGHFYRLFKERFGMLPGELRRNTESPTTDERTMSFIHAH
ncbi:MAG: AraC family transcriptional regulator [Bifidobacterium tsurumiense]|uniref:AraC family transcriptional regulator n=2 Tax=Bifidobacterium tsurumiense TaxID=356829 RepID=UPI002A7FAF07|nr:AraC family transcriptional regulator [Bifidobacterium tsurumiense]MDY4677388.1 AraC family transcriptional regulator [Bifidobacterium tsurumiense]